MTFKRPAFVAITVTILAAGLGVSCVGLDDADDGWNQDYGDAPASEMTFVPSGVFSMGAPYDPSIDLFSPTDDEGFEDERPLHAVQLSSFFIETTEVTNAQYRACVAAGACVDAVDETSRTRHDYYLNPLFDDYPVVHVTHDQAAGYCAWRGRRLPTEAEWEKAARGETVRRYPWGDSAPVCLRANVDIHRATREDDGSITVESACESDTMPVETYHVGASPYGALNMSGNVFEWTADRYASDYYDRTLYPHNNIDPKGPDAGERYVVRGGSYAATPYLSRVSYRQAYLPDTALPDLGFRCAADEAGLTPEQ